MKVSRQQLTVELVKSVLNYDPETGWFTWSSKVNSRGIVVGSRAGTLRSDGYRKLRVFGVECKEHNLAWFVTYGRWPYPEIDHRDRNRTNNAIGNLREATSSQNKCNSDLKKMSTSGRRGVSWSSAQRKWAAQINADGRYYYLGMHETKESALAAYEDAARRLHGEFCAGVVKRGTP